MNRTVAHLPFLRNPSLGAFALSAKQISKELAGPARRLVASIFPACKGTWIHTDSLGQFGLRQTVVEQVSLESFAQGNRLRLRIVA